MLPPMTASTPSSDPAAPWKDEFRQQLEVFYAKLKLAPPYHSVEKAITQLTALVRILPADEQGRLAGNSENRRALYRKAFKESGLHQKHRGIIAGLAKSGQGHELPDECRHFLELFA